MDEFDEIMFNLIVYTFLTYIKFSIQNVGTTYLHFH